MSGYCKWADIALVSFWPDGFLILLSKSFILVVSLTEGMTRMGISYICVRRIFFVESSLIFVSSWEHYACSQLEGTD